VIRRERASHRRRASHGPTTVVHLITTLTQGGAERMLAQLVPRPADLPTAGDDRSTERHIVVSLADGGMFADELVAAGVEVRGLGMRPGRDVVRGALRLAGLLRELRPTLVVSWMYHACLLVVLARPLAGRAGRARMVWNLRGSLHSLAGLPWHTRVTVRVLALASRVPDALVINSRTGRSHHIHHGYRPRRWIVLPNGCDTTRFRPDAADRASVRAELGIAPDAPVAISVARVHPQKDHATLLAALRTVHATNGDLELVLVGTGTEALATALPGALRVHGLGERRDVDRVLRAADVVVQSSLTEGLPNALLEGMASSLVPIATDVGDSAAVVGDCGHVVAPGDVGALAAAVGEVVRLDGPQRAALGARAREHVVAEYGLARARREYRALWDAAEAVALRDGARDPGPLRVVHVIARMNVGGPARILAGLLARLDPARFPQTLVTGVVADGEEDWSVVRDPAMAADPRIVRIAAFGRAISPLRDLRTQRALTSLLTELAPDVVQTHTAKAGLLGRRAALRAGVPHVIHTFHGHTLHGYFPAPVTALFTRLERRLARRTDDLLAVGARVRDELLAAGIGTPEQYTVLPPGVPDEGPGDSDAARRTLGLPADPAPVVAFIGRLSDVKRPDRFLAAAELVAAVRPDAIFLIAGDGEQRARLEALPRRADVRFLGWRGDVGTILAASDVVVVTSDNEGMPVTLIEAAMVGRVCVTTDVGSAGEVVRDGVTGRVVARDAGAVADAISGLLADPVTRAAMGTAARVHARTAFGEEALLGLLAEVYRRGPSRPRG
jgi:glycosyltransferase involved in cell wall biosynthesis